MEQRENNGEVEKRSYLRGVAALVRVTALATGIIACDILGQSSQPYRFGSVSVSSESAVCHGWAGIHLEFTNIAAVKIVRVCLSFRICDVDGTAWPPGHIYPHEYVVVSDLPSGATDEFCLDLTMITYYEPIEDLYIYDLVIDCIEYEDGSEWTDRYRSSPYPYEIRFTYPGHAGTVQRSCCVDDRHRRVYTRGDR